MLKICAKWLGYLFVGLVAVIVVTTYGFSPLQHAAPDEQRATFIAHPIGIYTHIFASIFALIIGPFQFSMRLRVRCSTVHRWLGRLYLGVGVLVGGLSALYMAQFAYGGWVAQSGFSVLAILWLHTGLKAYQAVRHHNLIDHRKWMIRNFSLTFAAVTLRLYIPISELAEIPYRYAYPTIAWISWAPNLFLAEWRYNRA